jgi:hypothetical protein
MIQEKQAARSFVSVRGPLGGRQPFLFTCRPLSGTL